MELPSHGDLDGEGNAVVSGQEVSPCEQHNGTCLRCGEDLVVKPRKKFQGEERRQRKTISVKVPQDEQEDGAGIFDELVTQAREKLGDEGDKPVYYILVAALYGFVTS